MERSISNNAVFKQHQYILCALKMTSPAVRKVLQCGNCLRNTHFSTILLHTWTYILQSSTRLCITRVYNIHYLPGRRAYGLWNTPSRTSQCWILLRTLWPSAQTISSCRQGNITVTLATKSLSLAAKVYHTGCRPTDDHTWRLTNQHCSLITASLEPSHIPTWRPPDSLTLTCIHDQYLT